MVDSDMNHARPVCVDEILGHRIGASVSREEHDAVSHR